MIIMYIQCTNIKTCNKTSWSIAIGPTVVNHSEPHLTPLYSHTLAGCHIWICTRYQLKGYISRMLKIKKESVRTSIFILTLISLTDVSTKLFSVNLPFLSIRKLSSLINKSLRTALLLTYKKQKCIHFVTWLKIICKKFEVHSLVTIVYSIPFGD